MHAGIASLHVPLNDNLLAPIETVGNDDGFEIPPKIKKNAEAFGTLSLIKKYIRKPKAKGYHCIKHPKKKYTNLQQACDHVSKVHEKKPISGEGFLDIVKQKCKVEDGWKCPFCVFKLPHGAGNRDKLKMHLKGEFGFRKNLEPNIQRIRQWTDKITAEDYKPVKKSMK